MLVQQTWRGGGKRTCPALGKSLSVWRKCGEHSARKKRGNPGRASSKSLSSVAKWPFVHINDYRKIIRERVSEKRDTASMDCLRPKTGLFLALSLSLF